MNEQEQENIDSIYRYEDMTTDEAIAAIANQVLYLKQEGYTTAQIQIASLVLVASRPETPGEIEFRKQEEAAAQARLQDQADEIAAKNRAIRRQQYEELRKEFGDT